MASSAFQVNFLDYPSFVCVMKNNLASKQSTPGGFSSGECGRGVVSLKYFLCCQLNGILHVEVSLILCRLNIGDFGFVLLLVLS